MKKVPTFREAWNEKIELGFQYGEDALEQVRFGWDIRAEYDNSEKLQAALRQIVEARNTNQMWPASSAGRKALREAIDMAKSC